MKYIFLSTSTEFSGHEQLFFKSSCFMAKTEEVYFCVNRKNHKAIEYLAKTCPSAPVVKLNIGIESFESIRSWFRLISIYKLYSLIRKTGSKKIVISQGRIESGVIGLIAARLCGITSVSYLPMAHDHTEMSDGRSAVIKDYIARLLYRLPSEYIVISSGLKHVIEVKSKTYKPIHILENYTENTLPALSGSDDYSYLGKFITTIGRVNFQQKNQDKLIIAFKNVQEKIPADVNLVVVGDGVDRIKAEELVSSLGLGDRIFFLGNRSDVKLIIYHSEAVIIPSQFEGVPLVLLEAAKMNSRIYGSDITGIRDFLKAPFLFATDDIETGIFNAVSGIGTPFDAADCYTENLSEVLKRTESQFCNEFSEIIVNGAVHE